MVKLPFLKVQETSNWEIERLRLESPGRRFCRTWGQSVGIISHPLKYTTAMSPHKADVDKHQNSLGATKLVFLGEVVNL